jgi:hypothetical protein
MASGDCASGVCGACPSCLAMRGLGLRTNEQGEWERKLSNMPEGQLKRMRRQAKSSELKDAIDSALRRQQGRKGNN